MRWLDLWIAVNWPWNWSVHLWVDIIKQGKQLQQLAGLGTWKRCFNVLNRLLHQPLSHLAQRNQLLWQLLPWSPWKLNRRRNIKENQISTRAFTTLSYLFSQHEGMVPIDASQIRQRGKLSSRTECHFTVLLMSDSCQIYQFHRLHWNRVLLTM